MCALRTFQIIGNFATQLKAFETTQLDICNEVQRTLSFGNCIPHNIENGIKNSIPLGAQYGFHKLFQDDNGASELKIFLAACNSNAGNPNLQFQGIFSSVQS